MNPTIINITNAEHVGGYCLRLQFDDATEQIVDLGPFLRDAQHPEIRAFLAEDKFLGYRLEDGNLVWGDYDLCFPVTDLHANTLWSPARSAAQLRPHGTGIELSNAKKTARLRASYTQRADHPIILGLPESSYLKGHLLEMAPGR